MRMFFIKGTGLYSPSPFLSFPLLIYFKNRLEECEVEVNDLSEKLQKKTEQAITARNEKEVYFYLI